jgi:hypothetical protein
MKQRHGHRRLEHEVAAEPVEPIRNTAHRGLFDRNRPSWADGFWGLVLPVEPRGFPQLVALVSLAAAMFIAMEIRGCAGLSTLPPE